MNHLTQQHNDPIPAQNTLAWFLSIPRRVANVALDKKKTLAHQTVRVGEISVRERQEQLAEFYTKYEDLRCV